MNTLEAELRKLLAAERLDEILEQCRLVNFAANSSEHSDEIKVLSNAICRLSDNCKRIARRDSDEIEKSVQAIRFELLKLVYTDPLLSAKFPSAASDAQFYISTEFQDEWPKDEEITRRAIESERLLEDWLSATALKRNKKLVDCLSELFVREKPSHRYTGELDKLKYVPIEWISAEVFNKLVSIAEHQMHSSSNPYATIILKRFEGVDGILIDEEVRRILSKEREESSEFLRTTFGSIHGIFRRISNTVFTLNEIAELVGDDQWYSTFAASERVRKFCLRRGGVRDGDILNNNMWTLRFLFELRGGGKGPRFAIQSMEEICSLGLHRSEVQFWKERLRYESTLLDSADLAQRLRKIAAR